jgi:hypothetical protein
VLASPMSFECVALSGQLSLCLHGVALLHGAVTTSGSHVGLA